MSLFKPLFTMIRDLGSLGYIPWGDFEVKTCKLEVFVLESQSAQMCKWRETLDFFYPLTEIKTAYFMEIEKHWWVSIDFFYGDRLISLMLSAFVILFWRHSDFETSFGRGKLPLLYEKCSAGLKQATRVFGQIWSLWFGWNATMLPWISSSALINNSPSNLDILQLCNLLNNGTMCEKLLCRSSVHSLEKSPPLWLC